MDLDALSRLFDTGYPSVRAIKNRYYVYLDGLDSTTEDAAQAAAEFALARLNAMAFIRYDNHRAVRILGPVSLNQSTGELITRMAFECHAEGRSRVQLNFQVDGKMPTDSTAKKAYALADSNEQLKHALDLYGAMEHNWVALYSVYELIAEDPGNQDALDAFSAKIKAFTGSANNPKVAGRQARHGTRKWDIPKGTLTLSEAQELIRRLLESWVNRL